MAFLGFWSAPAALPPVSPAVGDCYFDTVLGEPQWWDGAAWVSAGGGGGGGLAYTEVACFAGSVYTSNDSAGPLVLGTMAIDPVEWPATIGPLTRQVVLSACLYCDTGSAAAALLMQDITDDVQVGFISPASSPVPDQYGVPLTVGAAPGDLRNDTVHVYEFRLYRDGVPANARAFTGNVKIVVFYS
jgi:hypothetical protein